MPAGPSETPAAPAHRVQPEEIEFRLGIVKKLIEQRKHAQAAQVLREILDIDPQNASAYRMLGVAYSQQGSRDLACECYRRYLRFAVNPPDRDQVEQLVRACAP